MSEKTEQPTPKKLRDARNKGQVAKSKEIASAAVIIGLFAYIWIGWDFFMVRLEEMVTLPSRYLAVDFDDALNPVLTGIFLEMIILSVPVVIAAMVLGILANYFQVGALFALESIKPDLNKINPAQGIKKIFSMNNLIELIKSIVKILFLGMLIYLVIRDAVDPLIKIPYTGLPGILKVLAAILKKVVIYTAFAFTAVAAIDFFLQKHQHIKKLKMTKDEVKREYKEMEGDPVIKSKRKQLHKELVMSDTLAKVRKSSVVITNPTHIAVALYYDKEGTPLPVVTAKGEDYLARQIIRIAEEEDIPIMRNVPLARDLFDHGEVDQYIPSDLIEPVAEVLLWVQGLKNE